MVLQADNSSVQLLETEVGSVQNYKQKTLKKQSHTVTESSDLSDNHKLKNGIHIHDPNVSSDKVVLSVHCKY